MRAPHPECRTLSDEEKKGVEGWVKKRDALGCPPKHKELMRFIVGLLGGGVGPPVDCLVGHFITCFLKWHPAVAMTVARAMDWDRVLALNQKSLELLFKHLYEVIHCNHIAPDDMWNFDEKSFVMGRGGEKNELVISRVCIKTPRLVQKGNREWVTLIECVLATGK